MLTCYTKFNNIKDPVKKSHQHNVVYYATCPKPCCAGVYTDETGTRLNEKVIDHNRKDYEEYVLKNMYFTLMMASGRC